MRHTSLLKQVKFHDHSNVAMRVASHFVFGTLQRLNALSKTLQLSYTIQETTCNASATCTLVCEFRLQILVAIECKMRTSRDLLFRCVSVRAALRPFSAQPHGVRLHALPDARGCTEHHRRCISSSQAPCVPHRCLRSSVRLIRSAVSPPSPRRHPLLGVRTS